MYQHIELGATSEERKKEVAKLIRSGAILFGGYKKDRIYGLLNCPSGKKMKVENRVFFRDQHEAVSCGYRPCGRCMPDGYKIWRDEKKDSKSHKRKRASMRGEFYLLGGL